MEEVVKKAQAAANEKQMPMYVFRSEGLNGHELSWFSPKNVKNSPRDELYEVIQPEPIG